MDALALEHYRSIMNRRILGRRAPPNINKFKLNPIYGPIKLSCKKNDPPISGILQYHPLPFELLIKELPKIKKVIVSHLRGQSEGYLRFRVTRRDLNDHVEIIWFTDGMIQINYNIDLDLINYAMRTINFNFINPAKEKTLMLLRYKKKLPKELYYMIMDYIDDYYVGDKVFLSRGPQSKQSLPRGHKQVTAPVPQSSHSPSFLNGHPL